MKPLFRFLILLEVILCFGPATIMLAMSFIFIPAIFFSPAPFEPEAMFYLLPTIGGCLGLTALICLVLHLFNQTQGYITPAKMRLFIMCGVGAIILTCILLGTNEYGLVFYLLPVLATVHLVYLGRAYVFRYS